METQWLEQQDGTVVQFEQVGHTFLNEDTGEMYCGKCQTMEKVGSNRGRDFVRFIRQVDRFERFTEQHVHN